MGSGEGQASRTPLIVGNWKMFKTSREGAAFVHELIQRIGLPQDREVMVAPPFPGLFEAARAADGSGVCVAAQDVFWEREGAFTGEVSATMLADLGVKAAIIGHSERRRYFHETDEWVAKKVRAVLDNGLVPIMCVGETEDERETGATEEVLRRQVSEGLGLVRPEDAARVIAAYEPVWAIGTGRTATPEVAQEAIAFVRSQVRAALDGGSGSVVRILYGGSVGPANIDELMSQPDIDGALVGGASLQLDAFTRIVGFGTQ